MRNKTNNLLRILSLLLAFFVLLGIVACKDVPSGTTDMSTDATTDTTEAPEESRSFIPSHDYTIVYSELNAGHDVLNSAISRLSDALNAVYGISALRDDDYYRPAQGLMPDEYEILIGGTNRPQSQTALADLALNDYTYSIESENVIVICGGSIAATVEAIDAFCADVLGYVEGGKTDDAPALKIGTSHTHRVEYAYESAALNGVPLSEWTLAVGASGCAAELADTVQSLLGSETGERIKTVLLRDLTGEEENLIVAGAIGRELQSASSFEGCLYRVEQDDRGTVLSLTSTKSSLRFLKAHIAAALTHKTEGNGVFFTSDAAEYLCFDVEEDIDPWIFVSEHREEICEGVTYLEQVYRDNRNRPYRTYALFLDPNKVEFITGTSGDGYDCALTPEKRQNTQQHMEAAVANGKNVIAGINTNFFEINGDYSPEGIVIKDGVQISPPSASYDFFGVTEEGEIIIDTGSRYSSYVNSGKKFVHAVSGSRVILENGYVTAKATTTDIHPRSAIGIAEDGRIIIGVIDGRQANHSNGATLARTALWMRSLGAVSALNLDGGGSSNLIVRATATNTYTVCNSPSSGELRKIHTSLLVKLKENG